MAMPTRQGEFWRQQSASWFPCDSAIQIVRPLESIAETTAPTTTGFAEVVGTKCLPESKRENFNHALFAFAFSPGDKIEKAKSGYASFNRFRLCRFTFFHARQRDTLAPQLIGHATVSNRFSANSACVRCSSAASRS
jgi:hypothetical protein